MATPIEWSEALAHLDAEIRQGRIAVARQALEKLYKAKVPVRFRVRFSELARRCDHTLLGLRLLFPAVRSDERISSASAEEKAEYAACLTRIGAVEEAIFTLTPVAKELPQANLCLAFAHINRWEYARAVACLENYLKAPELSDYARSIGRFNLAASFTALDQAKESELLLEPLSAYAEEKELNFLRSACQELHAQNLILKEDWDNARAVLRQAQERIASESREAFFIRKWTFFVDWLSQAESPSSREALEKVRAEARARAHWETLRQADYYEALKTGSPELWGKLYYGTRFDSFREKILQKAGSQGIPARLVYPADSSPRREIDVFEARVSGKKGEFFNRTKLPYKLFQILASDWYRPFRLPTLFGLLYPKDFYHPTSSKLRVHFLIQKVRLAFKAGKVPARVAQQKEAYQLVLEAGGALVERRRQVEAQLHPHWETLRARFGSREFTAKQALVALQISERSIQRLLSEGCRAGRCTALGAGPARKYRLSSEEKAAAA